MQKDIKAYYSYPIGAKLSIQSKDRYWEWNDETGDYELISGWSGSGSTTVTLDRGFGTSSPLSKKHCVVKIRFRYVDVLIYTGVPMIYEELVYAVDTSTDGYYYTRTTSSWNGGAPSSYVRTAVTEQGDYSVFKLSKATESSWAWKVSVSMSVKYPWGYQLVYHYH